MSVGHREKVESTRPKTCCVRDEALHPEYAAPYYVFRESQVMTTRRDNSNQGDMVGQTKEITTKREKETAFRQGQSGDDTCIIVAICVKRTRSKTDTLPKR